MPATEETLPTHPAKHHASRRRWSDTSSSLTPADLAAVPAAVVARLQAAHGVLTVCHENPEADALGSALALALALEHSAAAPRRCAAAIVVPPMYDFMPHIERFRRDPEPDSTTT